MSLEKRSEISEFLKSDKFFDYKLPEFIQTSKPHIITSETTSQPSTDLSDYLVAFSAQSQSYCVGSVDMVNSTKISASIPSHKLSQYYEIFLNSMAKIIGKFGGKVIKNIGDCLLYYFPESADSRIEGFRSCLDCGLAMIEAQIVICQQLTSQKLPCLSYRVSADCGRVLLMNTTESASIDMIGPPVNMCVKINRHAGSNEFVIGGDLYQLVKKLPEYKFCQKPSCNIGFKNSYPVYKVDA